MMRMKVENLVVCMVIVSITSFPLSAAVIEKIIDFEPPTYHGSATGHTLEGQDHWTGGGSDHRVKTDVVLSGTQSVTSNWNGANSYTKRPLAQDNLNFQDGYTVSYLVRMRDKYGFGVFRMDYKRGDGYGQYMQVIHDARHYDSTKRIMVNNQWIGNPGYFTYDETYQVTLVLDFTNQQVDVTLKEISGDNPGYTVSANDIPFTSNATAEEAENGWILLRGGEDSQDGEGFQVIDDITFAVPEPATIGLLAFGMSSLLRRR